MMGNDGRRRLVVGNSGATGIVYGIRILGMRRDAGIETHPVVSRSGQLTRKYETDLTASDLAAMADVNYAPGDVGASIASGSFRAVGMIVAPLARCAPCRRSPPARPARC
jgi:4-hydroxy-3-polyprenylbenzoate decarboxylase